MSDAISSEPDFLDGRLLVAMPGMGDPRFAQTVVYVCAHSADGAMGLIVNKRAGDLTFDDLLSQLNIETGGATDGIHVHFGGPVETGRGFVLHSGDYRIDDATMEVEGGVCLTATIDILRAIASGDGPSRALLALGYAGWAPGQLEVEIQHNGWLDCPADPDLIFGDDDAEKWADALRRIGVDPAHLSGVGGRA